MQRQGLTAAEQHGDVVTAQEAGTRLDVLPEHLAVWSDRCGCPVSEHGGGYRAAEITALADALESSVSISAAIVRARRETSPLSAPRTALAGR